MTSRTAPWRFDFERDFWTALMAVDDGIAARAQRRDRRMALLQRTSMFGLALAGALVLEALVRALLA